MFKKPKPDHILLLTRGLNNSFKPAHFTYVHISLVRVRLGEGLITTPILRSMWVYWKQDNENVTQERKMFIQWNPCVKVVIS